jgi:hypothetical protein
VDRHKARVCLFQRGRLSLDPNATIFDAQREFADLQAVVILDGDRVVTDQRRPLKSLSKPSLAIPNECTFKYGSSTFNWRLALPTTVAEMQRQLVPLLGAPCPNDKFDIVDSEGCVLDEDMTVEDTGDVSFMLIAPRKSSSRSAKPSGPGPAPSLNPKPVDLTSSARPAPSRVAPTSTTGIKVYYLDGTSDQTVECSASLNWKLADLEATVRHKLGLKADLQTEFVLRVRTGNKGFSRVPPDLTIDFVTSDLVMRPVAQKDPRLKQYSVTLLHDHTILCAKFPASRGATISDIAPAVFCRFALDQSAYEFGLCDLDTDTTTLVSEDKKLDEIDTAGISGRRGHLHLVRSGYPAGISGRRGRYGGPLLDTQQLRISSMQKPSDFIMRDLERESSALEFVPVIRSTLRLRALFLAVRWVEVQRALLYRWHSAKRTGCISSHLHQGKSSLPSERFPVSKDLSP